MAEAAGLEMVDAHVHLWHLSAHTWYPGIQIEEVARGWSGFDDVSRMSRDFLLGELAQETAPHRITGIVHVEATTAPRAQVEETRWLDALLDTAPFPAVLICSADRTLPLADFIADLELQAASPRFRGARVFGGLEPESELAAALCDWLDERGAIFDLCSHPSNTSGYAQLLSRHPNLEVVLEHIGGPEGTDAKARREWQAAITELAANPRVSCKLSGVGMVTRTLAADAIGPWLDACLETFGPERCIFGGNFPVEALYGTYGQMIDSFMAVIGDLPEAQQVAVMSDNARRVYGI
jgi:predicted TIM-barrel fold metal-dependent hydrolase